MPTASSELQRVLLYNPDRCTGCMNCVISCAFYHFKKLDSNKAHLRIVFNEDTNELEAAYCLHCEDPPCLASCPTEAIFKDEQAGWVKINPARCIGCKTCTFSCPLSVPWFDEEHRSSTKCDFCDGEPRCAMVCSSRAIRVATRQEAVKFNFERYFESAN